MKKILIGLVSAAVGFSSLWAQTDSSKSSGEVPLSLRTTQSFWRDDVGSGFKKGTHEIGGTVGYAFGGTFFGTSRTHTLGLGAIDAGWIFTDVVADKSIFRGNWEVMAELFGGHQFTPHDASLGGLDLFLRYDFATGTRWVPFIEAGAGVMATDIGTPDLSTAFQFNEKAGIGVAYYLSDRLAMRVEARFMHISNASIHSPNLGVNTLPLLVGVSYLF